jgi:hypothetical protein
MPLPDLEAMQRALLAHPPVRPAVDCPFEEWTAWRREQEVFLETREAVNLWVSIKRYDEAHPEEATRQVGKGRGRRSASTAEEAFGEADLLELGEPDGDGEDLDLGEVC